MPQQARSQQTRLAIIRGAAEIFDRYGYGSATLSDIVATANVTKGSMYFHFRSKEEIAHAVIEQQHELSIAPGEKLLERDDTSGLISAIQLSQRLASQLMQDPVVRAGVRLTLETGTFSNPHRTPYRDWMDTAESLLQRASDTGEIHPTISPRDTAHFIVSAFTGVQLVSQVLAGREDLSVRLTHMWDLLLAAMVPARKLPYFRSALTTSMALDDDSQVRA